MFSKFLTVVLFGAKIITNSYELTNSNSNRIYDKNTGLELSLSFIPTTYNSLLKIEEKYPYSLEFSFYSTKDDKICYYIDTLELLFDNSESFDLISLNPKCFFKDWNTTEKNYKIFRMNNIPIDRKIDKLIVRTNIKIKNQKTNEIEIFDKEFVFRLKQKKQRWFPTT